MPVLSVELPVAPGVSDAPAVALPVVSVVPSVALVVSVAPRVALVVSVALGVLPVVFEVLLLPLVVGILPVASDVLGIPLVAVAVGFVLPVVSGVAPGFVPVVSVAPQQSNRIGNCYYRKSAFAAL